MKARGQRWVASRSGASRRGVTAVLSAVLALSGMVVLNSPASAADTVGCGDTVNTNVTLTHDLGPCPGNGLVIGANGITVNLNGYTITGSNTTNTTTTEYLGILVEGFSNVTVRNGTVQNFDAGVSIVEGGTNHVRNLTVHDNVNHSSLTGAINPCSYGDGITVFDSSNNVIAGNTAFRNGPFSGVSLVGNSDENIVRGNRVYDQNVANELPPVGSGENGPCGPFSATPEGAGRLYQDVGIRIEGPGAENNEVLNNRSYDNQLNGIAIHGYVCGAPATPPNPPLGTSNTGNLIQGNDLRRNGFQPDGEVIDGIGILRQGPFGTVVCASHGNRIIGNTVIANARDGIFVPPTGDTNFPSAANTVSDNTVSNNGRYGIRVEGPFTVCPQGQGNQTAPNFCNVPREPRAGSTDNRLISNRGKGNGANAVAPTIGVDGFDGNRACDNNVWRKNMFGTVNQACVARNGTGTALGPIIP